MITAWQIYWVMQLDSIGLAFGLIGIAGLGFTGGAFAFGCMNKSSSRIFPELDSSMREAATGAAQIAFARKALIPAILLFLVGAFIPSTKTAAMMLVIPAVANNQAIQHEAGDLYGIAKDALRELARPKNAEKSK